MSAVTRSRGGGPAAVVFGLFMFFVVLGLLSLWSLAAWLNTGVPQFVNPMSAILEKTPWTEAHTTAAVIVGVVLAALLVLMIVGAVRSGRDRSPADRAAPYMGKGKEIAPLLPAALRKRHKRMGIPREFLGIIVGYTVAGRVPVRASYEDTLTVIAGPRRNKSVSIVTPNILSAPGPMAVTSVKPDLLKDTLAARAAVGTVSIFDPQRLAAAYTGHHCWWNPLAGISTVEDAAKLAAVFAAATYGDESNRDPFFPQNGRTILSRYLFAAAVAGEYLPTVATWLGREDHPAPVDILERSGYPHVAAEIRAKQKITDKTRSGIFAYAQEAMSFLASESVREWVQPYGGHPEFDPRTLVASTSDTLYLFSEEGPGSAGPLIAALTRAVLSAAEETAKHQPSGRLPKPFLAILDEAGNICRIPDLPDKYTTYGSRGIIPLTILQTQEQGEEVWGTTGFGKLWSSSTVKVFGGGPASNTFLRDLSELIGDYQYTESTKTHHNGSTSVNVTRPSERIMDVSDLGSLSLGRMVIFASGCRPTLVRSIPWWKDKKLRTVNADAAATAATKKENADAA